MNSLLVMNSAKSLQKIAPIATKALVTSPLVTKTAVKCMPIIAQKLLPYMRHQNVRPFHYSTLSHSNYREKQLLSDIANGKFINITKDLDVWLKNGGGNSSLEIYDESRILNGLPEGKNTYLGGNCCQMTSHLLARELVKDDYEVKLFLNKFRNYPSYHFYLTATGNGLQEPVIVDPSYRQFFRKNDTLELKEYNEFLFEKNDPFFVGTREDINNFVTTLLDKKPKPILEPLPELVDPKDGTIFWDPRTAPIDLRQETIYWNARSAIDVTDQLEKLRPIMEKFTDVNFVKIKKV